LVVADFAALLAVVEAVGPHAAIVLALADGAILLALAVVFVLLTDHAFVAFAHMQDCSAKAEDRGSGRGAEFEVFSR
jgi:hypothetical protein